MRDGVLIGVLALVCSGMLIVLGLLRWKGEPGRRVWTGGRLLWPGVVVLGLSAGWLLLIAYADANIQ
jgi:hypothetical protein